MKNKKGILFRYIPFRNSLNVFTLNIHFKGCFRGFLIFVESCLFSLCLFLLGGLKRVTKQMSGFF